MRMSDLAENKPVLENILLVPSTNQSLISITQLFNQEFKIIKTSHQYFKSISNRPAIGPPGANFDRPTSIFNIQQTRGLTPQFDPSSSINPSNTPPSHHLHLQNHMKMESSPKKKRGRKAQKDSMATPKTAKTLTAKTLTAPKPIESLTTPKPAESSNINNNSTPKSPESAPKKGFPGC
ncbi:hypothetical protein PGTUg99_028971 [Puccinia graminis f. sp. tritici]|uniref:Uncharacterized protein n=1 Tax=Puccinia graminis f. sp. tritici TaxID=56615 RepID=A0A5B0QRE7_PUCGR|nr:hypothetical protein PGTUg99_028971 [Puccinia graminis f. sp. tritici]